MALGLRSFLYNMIFRDVVSDQFRLQKHQSKLRMKFLSLICVLLASGTISASVMTRVHKFENGFVERSIAIVVRDKTAHIVYSVGLNELTVRELLANWEPFSPGQTVGPDSTKSEVQQNPESERFGDQRPANSTGQAETSPRSPSQPSTKATVSSGVDPSADTRPKPTEKPTSSKRPQLENSSEDHVIPPDLLLKFKELAPVAIANGMKISCNGKPITIDYVNAGPPPRHPFTMSIEFTFQVPDSETCDLKISDDSFAQNNGAVRYALKAAGRAMLIQSDVAPILVRAERCDLTKLSKKERSLKTSVNARLGFAPPRQR